MQSAASETIRRRSRQRRETKNVNLYRNLEMPAGHTRLIRVAPESLRVSVEDTSGWRIDGTELVRGVRRYPLPRPHRRSQSTLRVVDQVAYVLFRRDDSCERQGRYVLDVVDLGTGRSREQWRGHGEASLHVGNASATLLQVGPDLYRYPRQAGAPVLLGSSAFNVDNSKANWGCQWDWSPRGSAPTQ